MISYPVSPESRWAVLQISTGQIISRNKSWPRADGQPIEGLDPDFVYLLHVTAAQPDYDSRYYVLEGVETVDAAANELRLDWNAVKRPVEEQVAAAENVEAEKTFSLVRLEREAIETRLMLAALIQFAVDGQQLPPKARTMATEYVQKGLRIWRNRDRLREILTGIQAGEEPDLDTGWEED